MCRQDFMVQLEGKTEIALPRASAACLSQDVLHSRVPPKFRDKMPAFLSHNLFS